MMILMKKSHGMDIFTTYQKKVKCCMDKEYYLELAKVRMERAEKLLIYRSEFVRKLRSIAYEYKI
jgi:hypothetical protein